MGEITGGYWSAGVSALTTAKKQPIPVFSRIYSTEEKDYVSNNAETIKSLEFLSSHFPKSNIRALDRGSFKEFKILQHLRNAGVKKRLGFTCAYLFQIVFCLIFHHRNWYQLLESPKGEAFPGKDTVYRFLNHAQFPWRRFLSNLSSGTIHTVTGLTAAERVKVLIIDDSMYDRNRSKSVELLARFREHACGCYYKGFRMLTLGWSDGPHVYSSGFFALKFFEIKDQ